MAADGLVTRRSAHDFVTTLGQLLAAIEAKGLSVFATIDHAAGAEEVGLSLRPTTVVTFGNARGGTPLMQEAQTVGLDLPLKVLIWEDAEGAVHASYNDVSWIAQRYGVTIGKASALAAGLDAIVKMATDALTSS